MDLKQLLENISCAALVVDENGSPVEWNISAADERGNLRPEVLDTLHHRTSETNTIPLAYPYAHKLVLMPNIARQGDITRSINLLSSPPFLKTMLENVGIGITIVDTQGNVVLFSSGAEKLTGYSAEEIIEKKNIIHLYADKNEALQMAKEMKEHGTVLNKRIRIRRKDGHITNVLISVTMLKDRMGNIVGSLGVSLDITKEEQLRRLALNVLETMPIGIAALDTKGMALLYNSAFLELCKGSACTVSRRPVFYASKNMNKYREHFEKCIKERRAITVQREKFKNRNGSISYRSVSFFPAIEDDEVKYVIMRVEDTTDSVQFEQIAVAAEKMNAVSGLAAGIAHEINNPLSGIIQSAEFLKRSFEPNRMEQKLRKMGADEAAIELISKYIESRSVNKLLINILQASERVSRTIGSIIEFSRKRKLEQIPIVPTNIMKQALALAESDADIGSMRDIVIVEDLKGANFEILADRQQLIQVFLHIIRNSVERIRTRLKEAGSTTWKPELSISYEQENDFGIIKISDNGEALSTNTLALTFEPFFSTKKVASGGSLAVAVARFILTEFLQGELNVESVQGMGTIFVIKLPLAKKNNGNK